MNNHPPVLFATLAAAAGLTFILTVAFGDQRWLVPRDSRGEPVASKT